MITIEELLKIIYTYYPKNINTDDVDRYVSTPENQLRMKACENARNDRENWLGFKRGIIKRIEDLKGRYADYSVLGSVPVYHLRIYVDDWFDGTNVGEIAIFISVISPYWTYFYESPNLKRQYNFPDKFNEGIDLVNYIDKLIKIHFEGYSYLSDDLHQIKVEDISSAHKRAPDLTIFDALFYD